MLKNNEQMQEYMLIQILCKTELRPHIVYGQENKEANIITTSCKIGWTNL